MQQHRCTYCKRLVDVSLMYRRLVKSGEHRWFCSECPKTTPLVITPVGGTLGAYRILARRLVAVTEADLLPQMGVR